MHFFPGGYDACDGTIGGLAEGRGMKPLERICLVFGVFLVEFVPCYCYDTR